MLMFTLCGLATIGGIGSFVYGEHTDRKGFKWGGLGVAALAVLILFFCHIKL